MDKIQPKTNGNLFINKKTQCKLRVSKKLKRPFFQMTFLSTACILQYINSRDFVSGWGLMPTDQQVSGTANA